MRVIFIIFILLVKPAGAETIVHPTKDAFVVISLPNQNFGSLNMLNTGFDSDNPSDYDERSLISWQELRSGESVPGSYNNVQLSLYVTSLFGDNNDDILVFEITHDWAESYVNWNNRPSRQEYPYSGYAPPSQEHAWYTIDITERFDDNNFGVYLSGEGFIGYGEVWFVSSDDNYTDYHPKLIFDGTPVESESFGIIKAAFK